MVYRKHEALLRDGILWWNDWRQLHHERRPDLRHIDLSYANLNEGYFWDTDLRHANLSNADLKNALLINANLSHADLSYTKLQHANLSRAKLWRANLWSADLSHAKLQHADLTCADLRGADLRNADLDDADLRGADLSGAKLIDTHFSGVHLGGTIFALVDLKCIYGLNQVIHESFSPVDIKTVLLPQGHESIPFLRGTGFPDSFIDALPSLLALPPEYFSVFISYADKDNLFARRLHADLQDHGVRCWFAPEDMKIGDKIRPRVDEAIYQQDKLLLLLSEHALSSNWVEAEVEAALEKEQRQQREVLFPVRLDESVMQANAAWAASLRRTRHIGDFTQWTEPQVYQHAFERLLRDLKAQKQW